MVGRWYDETTSEKTDSPSIAAFRSVKDELTIGENADFLLRKRPLVMPTRVQIRVIQLVYERHQWMNKTKALIRSKVWFPGIDRTTEAAVKGWIPCQANSNQRQMEPLNMTTLPTGPWVSLSIDFCGPLPSGEYLLTIINEYSRYPMVQVVRSTSADTVIPCIETVFAMFGYPETIKSDNGAPFRSKAWSDLLLSCGVRHRKITPLCMWPMANAQAENFHKPLMTALRSANVQCRNWRRELYQFLRNYRCTPHRSTLFTPHRLLFGWQPCTKLPECLAKWSTFLEDKRVRKQDAIVKGKMKTC